MRAREQLRLIGKAASLCTLVGHLVVHAPCMAFHLEQHHHPLPGVKFLQKGEYDVKMNHITRARPEVSTSPFKQDK